MRILFIGDIISKSGRKALKEGLYDLRSSRDIDLVIGNVENAAGIFGITDKVIKEIKSAGVDVMTSGNHVWDKREGIALLDTRDDIIRPANYPPMVPGKGFTIKEYNGIRVAVINIQGRIFMTPIDCPFRAMDDVLKTIPRDTVVRIVDFHAEATSEKIAMGYYLDGRVSAVIGTHTHVQTADERILSLGTAYLTDAGMTGPIDSVIGVKKEQIIDKFITGIPTRMNVAHGDSMINGVMIDVDDNTGKAHAIERIHIEIRDNSQGGDF